MKKISLTGTYLKTGKSCGKLIFNVVNINILNDLIKENTK